ncbi:hypothetical protein HY496_02035 [Candidatus Woesearchaeota archaeon]|nr:hypothetical protein [Candidatus Woesearchaeota archaeon]
MNVLASPNTILTINQRRAMLKPMFTTPANLALKIALKSQGRFKMGAVLAKGNRILSWGINNGRHCEVSAICNYARLNGQLLPGTQLYIARVSKEKKQVGLAKPCEDCQRFIRLFEIQEVWYTTGHQDNLFTRLCQIVGNHKMSQAAVTFEQMLLAANP